MKVYLKISVDLKKIQDKDEAIDAVADLDYQFLLDGEVLETEITEAETDSDFVY